MKQLLGYLLIGLSFLMLMILSKNIFTEVEAIDKHKETIENAIYMPTLVTEKPLTLVDRNGDVFSEEYIEWRQPLLLNEIPTIAQQIFLLSEDEDFYTHIGFDVSAIARAVVLNTNEATGTQGGSTITQQLVRMRYLSTEKTYERKLLELFYAYELEQNHDKDTILEMYLNEAYFSNQVYGIGGAATFYFNKPIQELTTAELAFIAAIPNNPSLYDPIKNFENTKARQERLLDVLMQNKVLTTVEGESLKETPIILQLKKKIQKYPAYTTFVLNELRQLIAEQEGLIAANKEEQSSIEAQIDARLNQLIQSGAQIYTALDPVKQGRDEEAIDAILSRYEIQSSATVIDNTTREVVSLYAGKNYQKYDLNRAFQAPRQPGSAFKPIAAYAPFFEETGYAENYLVSGAAFCVKKYCPSNYGGGIYGNVTVKHALAFSYNTSALRLVNRIGIEKAFSYIDRLAFQSIEQSDRNYAAALGGLKYGVTTSELADAYTSFIDGSYRTAHSIRRVVDVSGETIYSWPKNNTQIWSGKTVKTMRSLLIGVVNEGTGRGLRSSSSTYLGAKTGTTNNYWDFWLAGLNDQYTTAVWIGYDVPRSMQNLEKKQIHFDIFNQIMK